MVSNVRGFFSVKFHLSTFYCFVFTSCGTYFTTAGRREMWLIPCPTANKSPHSCPRVFMPSVSAVDQIIHRDSLAHGQNQGVVTADTTRPQGALNHQWLGYTQWDSSIKSIFPWPNFLTLNISLAKCDIWWFPVNQSISWPEFLS